MPQIGAPFQALVVVPDHVVPPMSLPSGAPWRLRAAKPPQSQGGHRMKLHGNAKLSVKGRELLVERVESAGWSLTAAAEAAGVSERTASKWLARYRAEGLEGLLDRSSAPALVANRTDERRVEVIA